MSYKIRFTCYLQSTWRVRCTYSRVRRYVLSYLCRHWVAVTVTLADKRHTGTVTRGPQRGQRANPTRRAMWTNNVIGTGQLGIRVRGRVRQSDRVIALCLCWRCFEAVPVLVFLAAGFPIYTSIRALSLLAISLVAGLVFSFASSWMKLNVAKWSWT